MSTEEKINQAKGTVKEGFGKLTGDKKTEKEGAAEKVVSKVKEVAEDAKDCLLYTSYFQSINYSSITYYDTIFPIVQLFTCFYITRTKKFSTVDCICFNKF